MSVIVARWRDWPGTGLQHVVLEQRPDAIVAEAAVLAATDESTSFAAHFRILCDAAWRTRRVRAHVIGDDRRIDLVSHGDARWRDASGAERPDLDGAFDVDFNITPFTNTLPIRRLKLGPGQSTDLRVVYISLPDFIVTTDPQRYTCLDPGRTWRFESLDTDFSREIRVDSDGLVVTYPGLFRRIQ